MPAFDPAAALAAPVGRTRLSEKLRLLRPLLAKDILNIGEMKALLNCAYSLVAYSSKWNSSEFQGLPASHTLIRLAYRLLVADALLCICVILGPAVMKPNAWWDRFAERLTAPSRIMPYRERSSSTSIRQLEAKFLKALDMYKQQRRPPEAVLVELKRKIFCLPCIHTEFYRQTWDAWRKDDEEFQ